METLILILVIAFLSYEVIEHLVFPLAWSLLNRKKRSFCGPERMIGSIGEVKKWGQKEGVIFIDGELWRAVSPAPLKNGNKVMIQKVEGLTLTVDLVAPKEEGKAGSPFPLKG